MIHLLNLLQLLLISDDFINNASIYRKNYGAGIFSSTNYRSIDSSVKSRNIQESSPTESSYLMRQQGWRYKETDVDNNGFDKI